LERARWAWSLRRSSGSFGTEVTILEFLPRMVPVEDEEISKELARLFKKRGIDVNTGAKVEKVEKTKTA
jgi:dihydrolipoamide dehydrogenase